jgi:hypothetical protein
MIKYPLALLLLVFSLVSAKAQNDNWFKGNWYGIKSFPRAHIGIKVLVRIEVDSLYNNHFSGRLIYMYPKDTIARLIRTFEGNINSDSIVFNKSKELYLLDPRSRGFWNNCTQCNESGVFLENHGDLVFKITTTGCGDSCDAETVFSRSLDSYDSVARADIQKMFNQNKEPGTVALQGSPKKIKDKEHGKKILVDSARRSYVTTASATKPANNGNTQAIVAMQGRSDSNRTNTNLTSPTKESVNANSKTDSSIAKANTNSKQKASAAMVAMQGQPDSTRNNTNVISSIKKPENANSKTDSSIATASTNSKQENSTASVVNQDQQDSAKNNTNATSSTKKPVNTNSKTDSLIAAANTNAKQKTGAAVVAMQVQPDSSRNNPNVTLSTKKPVTTNSKTDSLIATANTNAKHENSTAAVVKQDQQDSARNNTNMASSTKKPVNTNLKADSSITTANTNSKPKTGVAAVAMQGRPDSARNNTNVGSSTKKPVNTNLKADSSITTANTNSKPKTDVAVVAMQGRPDSARNNTNTTSSAKKPVNTKSKTDSSIATTNTNSKQKNGALVVAMQGQPDSTRNNTNVTSSTKKPVNTNSKTDSLIATTNGNAKQKKSTAGVAMQNATDPGKKDKTTTASNTNPAAVAAPIQNNIAAKATADTTKNKQPLSDSSSAPLPLVAAKTFMLADTANQFVSRTDSVAMAKLNRETNIVNEYKVSDPHIEIELFDNGIIDGDAVSVYYNGRMLFNNVVLSYKPIAFSIDASGANRHHEFVLIAENEGSIPPNTALLRITAGNQQYKLFVSTNLSKNAKIAIDYTGD